MNVATTPSHAMWREIHEQPRALADTLAPHIEEGQLAAAFIRNVQRWLGANRRIVIIASGSSRHAGLIGRAMIESLSGVPVHVEFASEYGIESSQLLPDAAAMVISQSGETSDTLAALRNANAAGLPTLSITNMPNSRMAREAAVSAPTHAGIEQAIPATKSFLTQLAMLQLIALAVARIRRSRPLEYIAACLQALVNLPETLQSQLANDASLIDASAARLLQSSPVVYLARGTQYGMACEGALKLKESAYVHAEAMPTGEFRHGPIAMLDSTSSLVILAARDAADSGSARRHALTLQLLGDLRARETDVCAIASAGDTQVAALSSRCIFVPALAEHLLPFVLAIPLQLLAYRAAVLTSIDVDRPRNLVKSVTAAD